jgi:hypothetical protein
MTDTGIYAPVIRDRVAERERCERDIPGYSEQRQADIEAARIFAEDK